MSEVELVSPFVLEYTYKRSLGPILSRVFTALRDGRLEGAATRSGRVLVPPDEYDPETGEDIVGLVPVGPEGVVTSWTWVPSPGPRAPLQEPFAWALIRLDGADTSLLHVLKGPKDSIATGMRVRPCWREPRIGALSDLLYFVPTGSEAPRGTRTASQPSSTTPSGDLAGGTGSVGGTGTLGATGTAPPVKLLQAPTRIDYVVTAGEVTAEFLRGILRRELNGRRCPACQKVYIPPRGACPIDGVSTTEVVPLSQRGTITTFSVVRFPFEGQVLTPPYVCAHIVLDGADVPLLHIVGEVPPEQVRMGMRVEAVWAEQLEPTLASVRYFRPVDEPDVPYEAYRRHLGEGQ